MNFLEIVGAFSLAGMAILGVGVAASLIVSGRESKNEEKYWSDYVKGGGDHDEI